MTRPPGRRWRKTLSAGLAAGLAASLLAACGDGGKTTLTWYINPDAGGQDAVAKNCSTADYDVKTQVLPQDAGQQRVQLARRLAAKDSGIDIMSIDPPYTAEFANAGFLAELPDSLRQTVREQSFDGAIKAASWKDKIVVAPLWSNVQVLWYRKSFVEKAGLDMSTPKTWDQIIDAAAQNGGKVAVQANKYEGYAVWINALISGADGKLASNTDAGSDATIDVNSPAGKKAAAIIEKLASSKAAPADLSVSTEGQAGATFGSDQGAFLVNWTYIWTNYDATQPEVKKDIGYAPYPETVSSKNGSDETTSQPPYGGIGIGVSKYSDHVEDALKATACITKPENQGVNAELTGNMPASSAGYDYKPLKKIYPQDLLDLWERSLQRAAPRTVSPYWSDISGALQTTWHPPSSVNQNTPEKSAKFIRDVLKQRKLL